jgi:hypothetical protein
MVDAWVRFRIPIRVSVISDDCVDEMLLILGRSPLPSQRLRENRANFCPHTPRVMR